MPSSNSTLSKVVSVADDIIPMAQRNMQGAPGKADLMDAPGSSNLTDNIMGTASTLLAAPDMALMGVYLPSLAAGKATKWAGEKTGWNWAKNTGDVLGKPAAFLSQSFTDLGNQLGIREPVGRAMQGVANAVAWPLEKLGVNGWREGAHVRKGGKQLKAALTQFGDMPKELIDAKPMQQLKDILTSGLPAKEKLAQVTPQLLEGVTTALKDSDHKQVPKLLESLTRASDHHNAAVSWGNKTAIRNLPEKVKTVSWGGTTWNAAFVGSSALGLLGMARGIGPQIESLKHMQADLTGTTADKVSTMQILVGNVAAPVAEARSALIKNFGIDGLASGLNMLISVKQLVGGHVSMKAGAAQMALGMGGKQIKNLVGSSSAEQDMAYYKSFADAHKRGEAIPAQAYAEFVELRKGLKDYNESARKALAMKLGEAYAAEKAGPALILNEVENGKFIHRIEAMVAANEAAKPKVAAAPAPVISHVPGVKKDQQVVLGQHTGDYIARRNAQEKMMSQTV